MLKERSYNYFFLPIFRFWYAYWQQCPSKKFFMKGALHKNFFLQYSFQLLPSTLCALLIVFTKPFKIGFSWNYLPKTKKIYSENCISLFSIGTLYSHWSQCYSKLFIEKRLIKIFSGFFYIIIRVYTHWWMIPNETIFFSKKNKMQWRKCFLQSIISLFYGRSSVLSLTTMSSTKISHQRSFPKIIFSKYKF